MMLLSGWGWVECEGEFVRLQQLFARGSAAVERLLIRPGDILPFAGECGRVVGIKRILFASCYCRGTTEGGKSGKVRQPSLHLGGKRFGVRRW